LYSRMKIFYDTQLKGLQIMKNIELTICLNDDGEVLLRLKPRDKDTFNR